MNNLAIISNTKLTMTSREIADLTGKNHADVMRDIRNMVYQLTKAELLSCAKSSTYTGKDGREYPQYEMDKDTCLNLLLGYDPVARMKVVQRWQELEAHAAQPFNIPQTLPEALRLAADLSEQKAVVEGQLAIAAPKAEALDRIATASEGSLCLRDATKELQMQPKQFNLWMQANKWIYKRAGGSNFIGYQDRIQSGLLEHKASIVIDGAGNERLRDQVRVTAKGLARLAGLLQMEVA